MDENQIQEQQEQRTSEMDSLIWDILHLVQIDDFVRNELKSNFDEPIENKISGGQKTRVLLARVLYRAYHRNSSLLDNIIRWYRSKGILFLTLHTERAHLLNFDQILHIEQGTITKIK